MRSIALLIAAFCMLACGERDTPATVAQARPKTIQKVIVFDDGTTAQLELTPLGFSQWQAEINSGPLAFDMAGTQADHRLEFERTQCSEHPKLTIDLPGNQATFSLGLFSIDAKVTDGAPSKPHPATGEWEHFAYGVTFPGKVTEYSVSSAFGMAVHASLLVVSISNQALKIKPLSPYTQAMNIGPIIHCAFWGRMLRSGKFELYSDLLDSPFSGEFSANFTAVTFHYPPPVTQSSRKIAP